MEEGILPLPHQAPGQAQAQQAQREPAEQAQQGALQPQAEQAQQAPEGQAQQGQQAHHEQGCQAQQGGRAGSGGQPVGPAPTEQAQQPQKKQEKRQRQQQQQGPPGGGGPPGVLVELGAGKAGLVGMAANMEGGCGAGGVLLVDNRASFQLKADRHMRHMRLQRVTADLKVGRRCFGCGRALTLNACLAGCLCLAGWPAGRPTGTHLPGSPLLVSSQACMAAGCTVAFIVGVHHHVPNIKAQSEGFHCLCHPKFKH